jgi:hypothetical protein
LKSFLSVCRKKFPLLSLLMLSLFWTFAAATTRGPSGNEKCKAKHLFIIVANGVRYNDAFGNKHHLYTDNIWTKLRPLGTVCTKFYNNRLTYPIPAQASLLTGVWHVWQDPLSDTIRPAYPTIFEYWNKNRSGNSSYFATGKKQLGILSHSDYQEYGKTFMPVFDADLDIDVDTGTIKDAMDVMGNAVYKKAISYIFEHYPSFVYLNLDSDENSENAPSHALVCRVDSCEEEEAVQINTYYESIILIDAIVYDFWNRIQNDETYKNRSILIFLSAHGRHTNDFRGFGCNCRGCRQLNFLIIGPGIKKNYVSKKKRTLIDICRTVGALCDFPTPYVKGKIMKEIFE